MCPPVHGHLAIVRMYNPLKGRKLTTANDNAIPHIVCVLSLVTEYYLVASIQTDHFQMF